MKQSFGTAIAMHRTEHFSVKPFSRASSIRMLHIDPRGGHDVFSFEHGFSIE